MIGTIGPVRDGSEVWLLTAGGAAAAYSLTVHNASSGHYTLMVMTWVALLFTPVVLLPPKRPPAGPSTLGPVKHSPSGP